MIKNVVYVYHFFLDGIRVNNAMDTTTRYSAGLICRDTLLVLLVTL